MHVGWEYKTIVVAVQTGTVDQHEVDNALARHGQDGWEAYAVSPILLEGTTVRLVHHLRRPAEPRRRAGFAPNG